MGTALSLMAAVALGLAAWLRLPGLTRDTVWAEDGGVFLREALESRLFGGIFDPYDGYLHVLPRLLAEISLRSGGLEGYAERLAWLSCVCVGLVGVAVYTLSRPYVVWGAGRVFLALIPALLPVGAFEALGNTANLHWYMLWLVPWLLLSRTQKPLQNAGLGVVAFVAAATEIQTVLFVPLVVLALRRGLQWGASAGLVVGLAMQFITLASFPRSVSRDAVPWDPASILIGWLIQGVLSVMQTSSSSIGSGWNYFGGAMLLIPVLFLAAVIAVSVRQGRATLVAVVASVAASAAFWGAAQVFNNRAFMNYSLLTGSEWLNFSYLRYAVAPSMFSLAALALVVGRVRFGPGDPLLAAKAAESPRARPRIVGAAVLAVVLGLGYLPSYSTRAAGPSWSEQIAEARSACDADPALAESAVSVAPRGWEFERVPLPCQRLRTAETEGR